MKDGDWRNGFAKCVGVLLNGMAVDVRDEEGGPIRDDTFILLCNAHHDTLTFVLPGAEDSRWELVIDTDTGFVKEGKIIPAGEEIELMERSLCLLRLSGESQFLGHEESWPTREGKTPSKAPVKTEELG